MSPTHRLAHVEEARSRGGHRVWIRFDDGAEGTVDLAPYLQGVVFEPLREPAYFATFIVGEARTLCWSNGADFAPEFLHALVGRAVSSASG